MLDLINIVIPRIMDKWEHIAYAFRYDLPIINAIEQMENKDPERCCE